MRSLSELSTGHLEWLRDRTLPSAYRLDGGDEVVATLAFLDEQQTLARVETAEGIWTLKHLGVLTPAVTVRTEGGKTNLAVFHPHALRHGKLQFEDGVSFDWVWLHDAGPGGAFLDTDGLPLVRLRAHPGRDLNSIPGLERCEVDLGLRPNNRSRQGLLAALGWYLILFDTLKERDTVAAETALRL
ncbi:MAG: hypothetical protein H6P99_1295 [Holophagaceae bacterium]|nr:hypothetical protein [Holophagaceae bacterium]